ELASQKMTDMIARVWWCSSIIPIYENNSCLVVRQLLCQGIVWAYEFSAVPARAWIDRASGIRESTVGDRPPRLLGRGPGEQSGGRRRGPGARRGLHRGRHLDERRWCARHPPRSRSRSDHESEG